MRSAFPSLKRMNLISRVVLVILTLTWLILDNSVCLFSIDIFAFLCLQVLVSGCSWSSLAVEMIRSIEPAIDHRWLFRCEKLLPERCSQSYASMGCQSKYLSGTDASTITSNEVPDSAAVSGKSWSFIFTGIHPTDLPNIRTARSATSTIISLWRKRFLLSHTTWQRNHSDLHRGDPMCRSSDRSN